MFLYLVFLSFFLSFFLFYSYININLFAKLLMEKFLSLSTTSLPSQIRKLYKSWCGFFFLVLFVYLFIFIVLQIPLSPLSCLHFTPPCPPPPPTLDPSPPWLCPWVLYMCSLTTFSPILPIPPPLWLLSVCSLFQCLWLLFLSKA